MGLTVSSSKDSGDFSFPGRVVNESHKKASQRAGDTFRPGMSLEVDLSVQAVAPLKILKTHHSSEDLYFSSSPKDQRSIPVRSASAPGCIQKSTRLLDSSQTSNLDGDINPIAKTALQNFSQKDDHTSNNEGLSTFEEEISVLNRDLNSLENYYNNWINPINEFDKAQGAFFRYGKYIHANIDNLLRSFKLFLSSAQYTKCESIIDFSDWIYAKLLVPTESFVFDIFKVIFDNQIEKEIKKIKLQYYKLETIDSITKTENHSSELIAIHQRLDVLSKVIFQDRAACVYDCKKNGLKLLFNIVPLTLVMALAITGVVVDKCFKSVYKILKNIIAIHHIFDLLKQQNEWFSDLRPRIFIDKATHLKYTHEEEQEQLREDVQSFLNSLEECETTKEVKKRLKQANIKIRIPKLFVEWQQLFQKKAFQRELIQAYYHGVNKRPFVSSKQIDSLLQKRQEAFSQKIDQILPIVNNHIEECKTKASLDEIAEHFAKLNIYLDRLPLPPKDKAEWDGAISNPEFQKALAKQYVEYQESLAQLAEQAVRELLLSHHQMVRDSLIYHIFEHIALIGVGMIKIALAVVNPVTSLAYTAMEKIVIDLVKIFPNLSIAAILYPEWSFKIVALVLACLRHCIGLYNNPHEYSFEAYKLSFQIRWIQFISSLHSLKSALQKAQVWMTIQLIDQCVLRKKISPLNQDLRYLKIEEASKQRHDACSHQITQLNHRLDELRSLDITRNLFPEAGKKDSEHNTQQKLPTEKINAVKTLEEALNEGDYDYFPKSIREFLGKQLGVEVVNKNKEEVIASLNYLLHNDEFEFVASFQENRFAQFH